MTPTLLFCHTPFGKTLNAIREYVAAHQYAGVEWALDGWRVMIARDRRLQRVETLRRAAPICSVHAPYTDLEIGHRDREHAAAALRILRDYVDFAADLQAHHLNVHVGSFALAPEEQSWDTLIQNVSALMEHGARRGVAITLENLRHGLTSDPETFAALLRATGAPVTFDLGHAHGSRWVQSERGSVVDFLRSLPTRILASHIYFTERDDSHFAPATVAEVAEAFDALRDVGCDFWVLELHDLDTLERTREVVDEYLAAHGRSSEKQPQRADRSPRTKGGSHATP